MLDFNRRIILASGTGVAGGARVALFVLFMALALVSLASCVRDEVVQTPTVVVQSVSVKPAKFDLAQGSKADLVATVLPADATNPAVSWASSDPTVASVDAIGCVRGLKVGSATITATTEDGGKTATCAVRVVAPNRLSVSIVLPAPVGSSAGAAWSFEGTVDVPFDRTFDRVRADIKGFDWQVVGHVEAEVGVSVEAGGHVVALTLPVELSDADLCKVARDTYNDYAGWWPAETVSDRTAKVAGLGDILAYRGDVCVGRLSVSDGSKTFVYFHYANRPFSLSGNNLHRPDESDSYLYQASFKAGWNAYANISGQRFGANASGMICTTELPAAATLDWQFEAR